MTATLHYLLGKNISALRYRILIIALLLSLFALNLSIAANPVGTMTTYKVSSLGMPIGEATTSQRLSYDGSRPRVHFETKTRVNAALLWFGYRLESSENGTLLDGVLVNYSRKGKENGIKFDNEGKLQGGAFRFTLKENGQTRSVVIPRKSYDYTTMECPEAFLTFTGKAPVNLRILDVELQTVVNREYRFITDTSCVVGGREFPCRVVDFADENKSARRWVNKDGNSIVVYRQDNNDTKNAYSVRATTVTKEM